MMRLRSVLGDRISTPKSARKSIWEIIPVLTTLLSSVVIAFLGLWVNKLNNEQQAELRRLEVIDRFGSRTFSANPKEREYGYVMLKHFGELRLAVELGADRNDSAATVVLTAAKESTDKNIRDNAVKALLRLEDDQQTRIKAMMNVLEFGELKIDELPVRPYSHGDIDFGSFTLLSGGIGDLLLMYTQHPGAQRAEEVQQFLQRITTRDKTLAKDDAFIKLLKKLSDDPAMLAAHSALVDRDQFHPALAEAKRLGLTTALGAAVIYDSYVHGSFGRVRDRLVSRIGGTPATGIDEKVWVKEYLAERRAWFIERGGLLARQTFRLDAFAKLVEAGNWDLKPPFGFGKAAVEN